MFSRLSGLSSIHTRVIPVKSHRWPAKSGTRMSDFFRRRLVVRLGIVPGSWARTKPLCGSYPSKTRPTITSGLATRPRNLCSLRTVGILSRHDRNRQAFAAVCLRDCLTDAAAVKADNCSTRCRRQTRRESVQVHTSSPESPMHDHRPG